MNSNQTEQPGSARYLITGAKGCIGAWVTKNLVDRGYSPVAFDIDTDYRRLRPLLSEDQIGRVVFVQGDVTRLGDLERAVTDHRISAVIHLAGLQVPFCAADPVQGALVNVTGTLNVFEAARTHKDSVKHIVYASSAAVFGPPDHYRSGMRVSKDAPLFPQTHYGVFKQCNEGSARIYFQDHGISSSCLRPWAVYGFGRDKGRSSGPTKAIKAAVLGRPYVIPFTGGMDLQYADDIAKLFVQCADLAPAGARTYTPRGTPILVEGFVEILDRVIPGALQLIRADGPSQNLAYDLDDSALRADLGEIPRTPLEEGIRNTADRFASLQQQGALETDDLEA